MTGAVARRCNACTGVGLYAAGVSAACDGDRVIESRRPGLADLEVLADEGGLSWAERRVS